MDSSAQFRILHTVSGRSIPETAELLGENIRNINNWLKSVAPRYESTLQRMEEADEADEQWVSATVDATVDFAAEDGEDSWCRTRVSLHELLPE